MNRSILLISLLCACGEGVVDGSVTTDLEDPTLTTGAMTSGGGGSASGPDADGDGVLASDDCDDTDAGIGALLYEDDLSADVAYFGPTDQLGDDWDWDGSSATATDGGQEALIGSESWGDVVIIGELSAEGTKPSCGFDCEDSCGELVPDDCFTEWEALGLGILSVSASASGVLSFENSGDYDVCLSEGSLWDSSASQGVFVGVEDAADEFRVPAGGSASLYYGSWTTDNGNYSPYLDEADAWCFQNGTSFSTGAAYENIGALIPGEMFSFLTDSTDTDGDGVDDFVDWSSYSGVQAQYNIWDYQDGHAAVVVGKLASATTAGQVDVTLTIQNRGTEAASVQVEDVVPDNWALLSCTDDPDTAVDNADGTTSMEWGVELDGCTSGCSVIDEVEITCSITHLLNLDVDRLELDQASAVYDTGDGEAISYSLPAAAFDYDHNGDGSITCGETERWRAGFLGRAAFDDDQDEGFSGYRCALAQNSDEDCFTGGHFLQIGEFMDIEEDAMQSECGDTCANPSFDQLARTDHDGTVDISAGDSATLSFWMVGEDMVCEAEGAGGDVIRAEASDGSFSEGAAGFSTLNMFGDFDSIKVCEALALPE